MNSHLLDLLISAMLCCLSSNAVIELTRCTQVFYVLKYDVSYIPLFLFQVETVAQFGVIFLLFALGLEFSTAKVFYLQYSLIH